MIQVGPPGVGTPVDGCSRSESGDPLVPDPQPGPVKPARHPASRLPLCCLSCLSDLLGGILIFSSQESPGRPARLVARSEPNLPFQPGQLKSSFLLYFSEFYYLSADLTHSEPPASEARAG